MTISKEEQINLFPEILDFYTIPEDVDLEIIEAMSSKLEECYVESMGKDILWQE